MKAAVLKAWGTPLAIETVPDPVLGTGEVIVDMVATNLPSYAAEVFSGERKYPLVPPAVPGAGGVGRIRAVGPDATHLAPGDWVYCDCTVRSRDDVISPDITLQGLSARGEGGLKLQRYYHDGALPSECGFRRRTPSASVPSRPPPPPAGARWGWRSYPTAGSSPPFSRPARRCWSAARLAISAAPPLRSRSPWERAAWSRRAGTRGCWRIWPGASALACPVMLTGVEAQDRDRMRDAAPGPIDCVLDIMPPSVGASVVRAALMTVRPYGRVVLMGGVGMLGGDDLALPYPWIMRNCITIHGQWMYPQAAGPRLSALARSGLLDFGQYEVTEFSLDDANEAVAHAAANGGPSG